MNIFVPQSLAAQAEARELMMPAEQVLLQTTGAPCMGLVQDSLLGAYLMSERDDFYDRSETMQMMMWVRTVVAKTSRDHSSLTRRNRVRMARRRWAVA